MIVTLIKKDKISSYVLPEKVSGQYWVTDSNAEQGIYNLISIEGVDGQWILKSNRKASILTLDNDSMKNVVLEPLSIYNVRIKEHNENAIIYAEPVTKDRQVFGKFIVDAGTEITIGRAEDNDITYNNRYVSSRHAKLRYQNNRWTIEDLGSANGTFVNGIRVNKRILEPGDSATVLGFKILFGSTFLAINNPDGKVTYKENKLRPLEKQRRIHIDNDSSIDDEEEKQEEYFYISPRFKRDIERKEIKIDPPPAPVKVDNIPLPLLLGPSITMGMASLFTGLLTVMNAVNNGGNIMNAVPTLVMSLSMLLGTILWPIITKRYEKKQKEKNEGIRQEKYIDYLKQVRNEIVSECNRQAEILNENYIPVAECLERINKKERNLWERMQGHNDFLTIRLGKGDLPLEADIKYPERRFSLEDDNLKEELFKLAEAPKNLKNVPVTYSLMHVKASGIIGRRDNIIRFVNGIIMQIAALHSYSEVKMVFFLPEEERSEWDYVRWLPHTWDNDNSIRFAAFNIDDAKEISAFLEKKLMDREEAQGEINNPYYIIFSADKELENQTGLLKSIFGSKKDIGFRVITLYDELKNLPKECSFIVELSEQNAKLYNKDDITGKYLEFIPDIFIGSEVKRTAAKLADIKLDLKDQNYILPGMLTFLEMFSVGKVEHLNSLTRWKENDPVKTLQTPVGVNSSGDNFYLDLHEKFHGPHGLIAGMTGSGKSEFIITYILSMAVNYHPDEVAFILIDYKGGGLAGAFENAKARLPHLAGTITNLDGASIKRSLISIQSELRRRQVIFNDARKIANVGTMDIYIYQKMYRNGTVTVPLPHLFIISDEFAELKNQQPEFMEQLISAARIGRSLGIHLILATQKPSGVVEDQIWSNSRFRVCLKVQEKSDSMEMIKRPDAAQLSVTGRFYLQVGFNELFELGQSAWCGAPYIPSDRIEKQKDNNVEVIDDIGRVIKSVKLKQNRDIKEGNLKQNTEVLKYLSDLAADENIKVRPLWLEAIPALIYTEDLKQKYSYSSQPFVLSPVIGELDDPFNQRQDLLTLPISAEGNAVIYGAAGSGKTTLLTTLVYDLLEEHTSEELNIYAIDMGSETLRRFKKAPQVGDILLSNESEKIHSLFRMLRQEVDRRRKLFSNFGGDYASYSKSAAEKLPNILVIINNYTAFIEAFESCEDSISYLSREGVKLGIYFVMTASSSNAIRYRTLQNFRQLLALQQNDTSEYVSILGNTDGVQPSKIKGRGILKMDRTYEFQVAHAVKDEDKLSEAIDRLCTESINRSKGVYAGAVPEMPEHVTAGFFKEISADLTKLPVGLEKLSMKPATVDIASSYITLVLSRDEDVSIYMQGIAEILSMDGSRKVKVFDLNAAFENDADKQYDYSSSALDEQIVAMYFKVAERHNTLKDNNGKLPPDITFIQEVYIINSLPDLLAGITEDSRQKLSELLEKGRAGLNINIILSCSSVKLTGLTHEGWYRNHCSDGNGIWIGDGIMDRSQLRINKISNDLYAELNNGFGYVVQKGKYKLVKLISANSTGGDQNE